MHVKIGNNLVDGGIMLNTDWLWHEHSSYTSGPVLRLVPEWCPPCWWGPTHPTRAIRGRESPDRYHNEDTMRGRIKAKLSIRHLNSCKAIYGSCQGEVDPHHVPNEQLSMDLDLWPHKSNVANTNNDDGSMNAFSLACCYIIMFPVQPHNHHKEDSYMSLPERHLEPSTMGTGQTIRQHCIL